MRIDRGPSGVPKNGIPYLSKEGYPYRVFEKAHPDLVKAAKKMKVKDAIQALVNGIGDVMSSGGSSMTAVFTAMGPAISIRRRRFVN
jgi:hypothetical protein